MEGIKLNELGHLGERGGKVKIYIYKSTKHTFYSIQ
jgi:hypothetical protein